MKNRNFILMTFFAITMTMNSSLWADCNITLINTLPETITCFIGSIPSFTVLPGESEAVSITDSTMEMCYIHATGYITFEAPLTSDTYTVTRYVFEGNQRMGLLSTQMP